MPKNRKCPIIISVIILLFFVHLSISSQANSSDKTALKAPPKEEIIKQGISLKDKNIGYLGVLPMPRNYPLGYFPNKYVFTGEIYSKQPDSPLNSNNLFVPIDYCKIIESTLVAVMRFEGICVKPYSTITMAKDDAVSYILLITPHVFHVESESKALVKLNFSIIEVSSLEIVYEKMFSKEVVRKGLGLDSC